MTGSGEFDHRSNIAIFRNIYGIGRGIRTQVEDG
jgi:hypothetical protein